MNFLCRDQSKLHLIGTVQDALIHLRCFLMHLSHIMEFVGIKCISVQVSLNTPLIKSLKIAIINLTSIEDWKMRCTETRKWGILRVFDDVLVLAVIFWNQKESQQNLALFQILSGLPTELISPRNWDGLMDGLLHVLNVTQMAGKSNQIIPRICFPCEYPWIAI